MKIGESVNVEGRFLDRERGVQDKSLSFLLEYAGMTSLGERVSEVKLQDHAGNAVNARSIVAGEYLADKHFESFAYRIAVGSPGDPSRTVHTSFLDRTGGVLFVDDLLPLTGPGKKMIKFELPSDWNVFGSIPPSSNNEYELVDKHNGVFAVGANWRPIRIPIKETSVTLLLRGEWLFSDVEAAAATGEIFSEYAKIFGSVPHNHFQIALQKYPNDIAPGRWEADSRGSNITILSSDMPFKSQSMQRLHEQLRHEIFHLWIPNGVNLTGNYDWFYEGFALYESLKMGVAVNRIRFDDFLNTLSQAYYFDTRNDRRLSLIDASKGRWAGSGSTVYARGMLVAFISDLALLNASGGRRSTSDIVGDAYSRYKDKETPTDGNAAILSIIRSYKELDVIADRYISGSEKIDGADLFSIAGMYIDSSGPTPKLSVSAKLSRKQKAMLDALGYNSWRKLSLTNR